MKKSTLPVKLQCEGTVGEAYTYRSVIDQVDSKCYPRTDVIHNVMEPSRTDEGRLVGAIQTRVHLEMYEIEI